MNNIFRHASIAIFCLLTAACSPSPNGPATVTSTTAEDAAAKAAFITRIAAMPENCIYEESKESFIYRLNKGIHWISAPYNGADSQHCQIEYLRIDGDGCYGTRLFIRLPKGELYVLEETTMLETETAPQADTLHRYDAAKQQLTRISDKIPRNILAADSPAFPRDAWQRIEFFLGSTQR